MADRTVSVRLRADASDFVAKMRAAGRSVGDSFAAATTVTDRQRASLDDLSMTLGVVGTAAAAGAGLAVKSYMDFDKAMSSVRATGDDARGAFDQLREAAIQAGADTAFSATEAAEGIENLAKAGVSSADILGGGLTGALDLAAAGQIDVASASETAATALTQFNLTGQDVPHIADLLAAGAGKAQGEVSDMAAALQQSGLVASQFGLSIEETTGTLAAFASAGLIGSDAGTSFRAMLMALANPAEETKETMQQLGIAAYDAQGNFVGITSLAQQLQDRLGGLTQAQRDAALAQIFGNDAVRAANVLFKDGAAGIQGWIANVDDAGYASETAATKLDNLAGDLEAFKGSLETALIGLGENADGPLRGLVQGATDAVNAFNDLPGPVKGATLAIVGGGGLVALGAAGLMKLVTTISDTRDALDNLGITGGKAATALRFVGVPAAILGVTLAVDQLADHLSGLDVEASALAVSLDEWAQKGKLGGDAARLLGDNFIWLDDAMNKVADPSWFDTMTYQAEKWAVPWSASMEDAKTRITELDTALAHLATSGSADEAAEAFRRITERAREQGISVTQVRDAFPQYSDALRASKGAADEAATSADTLTTSVDDLEPPTSDAANALKNMSDRAKGLDERLQLLNTTMSNLDAESAYEQAVDDLSDRFKEYRAEVRKGDEGTRGMRDAFDLGTAAGRNNAAALRDVWRRATDYASKTLEVTGNQKAANAALSNGRGQLVDMATKFLGSRSAAEKYVTEVLGIPKNVSTQYNTPGLSGATRQAQLLKDLANNLDGRRVSTYFVTQRTEYRRTVEGGTQYSPGHPNFRARAAGGPVWPGEPFWVGEHGPELATFTQPATIIPHKESMALAATSVATPPRPATAPPPAAANHNYTFNMRRIDLNERTFAQTQRIARLRERVGRPS